MRKYMRTLVMAAVVMALAFVLAACQGSSPRPTPLAPAEPPAPTAAPQPEESSEAPAPTAVPQPEESSPGEEELKGFTLEELKEFDGKDGRAMYAAINGVVYDLTGVSAWSTGQHNGNQPGVDLSTAIQSAPHGISVLENLKIVGKLTE